MYNYTCSIIVPHVEDLRMKMRRMFSCRVGSDTGVKKKHIIFAAKYMYMYIEMCKARTR